MVPTILDASGAMAPRYKSFSFLFKTSFTFLATAICITADAIESLSNYVI